MTEKEFRAMMILMGIEVKVFRTHTSELIRIEARYAGSAKWSATPVHDKYHTPYDSESEMFEDLCRRASPKRDLNATDHD